MQSVEFCLLESKLAASSILSTPYAASDFGTQPLCYTDPTGIYLRLYGRSVDGRSVVVETECKEGLSILFLDVAEAP